jgi:hypothetical protein
MYVIDGDEDPGLVEKWVSRQQRFPWIEVVLSTPRDIDELVIRHAGWREDAALTHDRYTIRCYQGDALRAELGVVGNDARTASHAMPCTMVDRVRIQFDCAGWMHNARIYEVELWGPLPAAVSAPGPHQP